MAEKKASAPGHKKNSQTPILESLSFLFLISKVFGISPYGFSDYFAKKQFKLSQLGNIFCVLSCVQYIVQYHILTSMTTLTKDPESSIGALTTVIGIFIIYLEPLMMAIDVLASLINQKSLIAVFERLREVDDKLGRENILLNYGAIKRYSIIFVTIAFVGEVTLGFFNFFVFQDDLLSWGAIWQFVSCVPLFTNCIAKTWFLILILLVQQRLRAINDYLNDTKKVFFERKHRHVNAVGSDMKRDNLFIENVGLLEREIFSTRSTKMKSDRSFNWVGNPIVTNRVTDVNIFAPKPKGLINVTPFEGNEASFECD